VTLPVPPLRSWDPGDIGSAPLLNENVRDAFGFLLAPPCFIGGQSGTQSIPNNASTAVTWDYEVVDTYNGHSAQTNLSRYTVPFAGVWLVYGYVAFPPNATGRRITNIEWNGGAVSQVELPNAGAGANTNVLNWWLGEAAAADYFELFAYQSSGAAMNLLVSPAAASSYLQVQYVGGHL
jgi:hypothetical protein